MFYTNTKFLTSTFHTHQLPKEHDGIEIAFAGYSNVGKSSVLNILTKNKNLAYISKYPGKTKLINFFQVKKRLYLVDLPGYGYAKISKKIKKQWNISISEYLKKRNELKGLVLIMDIRYPIKYLDHLLIKNTLKNKIEIFVLLSKADKVNTNIQKIQLKNTYNKLLTYSKTIDITIFSSYKMIGIHNLYNKLNIWYKKFF